MVSVGRRVVAVVAVVAVGVSVIVLFRLLVVGVVKADRTNNSVRQGRDCGELRGVGSAATADESSHLAANAAARSFEDPDHYLHRTTT